MSYQVLARKWRPQVFDDVVGQGHITRTLQNAISSGRLAHAFLFSGPRGVGKTTTARILAKALNCAEGPTSTPCGKCDSCRETTSGTSVDVIEIDGASNRGIEHIRELREAVKYAPAGGRNKVYVIDEVHMLTNEAFNALLKTLEEPPPHVVFIFATTEPQKIPATILSRCQRYGFKRVSLHEIIGRLRIIADAEGISITDSGLTMIARAAEGSMRDSQSLLDQAVSYSGMSIKDEDLQATLGSVAQELLSAFTKGLLSRDTAGLLKQIDLLLEQGQDMRHFLAGVVEHLRNLLVVKIVPDPGPVIELPAADIEAIKEQAGPTTREHLLMLFDSLSRTLDDMRWSPHQRFTLEIGVIKACSIPSLKPLAEMINSVKAIEDRLGQNRQVTQRAGTSEQAASYSAKTEPQRTVSAPVVSGKQDVWTDVMNGLKTKKPSLATFLAQARMASVNGSELVILVKGTGFQRDQIEKQENRHLIETLAGQSLGRKVRLKVELVSEEKKGAAVQSKTISKKKTEEQDPFVQDALRIFGGEVIEQEGGEE